MLKPAFVMLAIAAAGCSQSPRGRIQAAPDPAGLPESAGAADGAPDAPIEAAKAEVVAFFGAPYPAPFEVRTFGDRAALDAFVAQRWKMPATECWMVAMGSGSVLVILNPAVWKAQACEHDGSDPRQVRQILTHELVHVFHGQHCPQSEFDGMDDMGWFVEGLAILAAGQLDARRIEQARAAAAAGLPHRLTEAWSGQARYAVSGSIVAYLDRVHGRGMIARLMAATTNEQALAMLGTTQERLLSDWRAWASAGGGAGREADAAGRALGALR